VKGKSKDLRSYGLNMSSELCNAQLVKLYGAGQGGATVWTPPFWRWDFSTLGHFGTGRYGAGRVGTGVVCGGSGKCRQCYTAILIIPAHQRFFFKNEMRYINPRFTYLLTY